MAWILGPGIAAFVIAWMAVGAVGQFTSNYAVSSTTFLGTFTAIFTGGAMKKKNKTVKKYRPQVMSLKKSVDSITKHK